MSHTETLAALLKELFPNGLSWADQGPISAAMLLEGRGVTVGPASPVRDPTLQVAMTCDACGKEKPCFVVRDWHLCLECFHEACHNTDICGCAKLEEGAPVRDPAPPDLIQDAIRVVEMYRGDFAHHGCTDVGVERCSYCPAAPVENDNRCARCKRADAILEQLRGVRDPSPPEVVAKKIAEWRALAVKVREDAARYQDGHWFSDAARLDVKARQLEACAEDLEAALGVRGAGVVASEVVAEEATMRDGPPAKEIQASPATEGPKVANEADLRVVPSAPSPSFSDEQLLEAFVAGCNAENELNAAELSPQNVRKGVAAAIRGALGGLSSAAAPPERPSPTSAEFLTKYESIGHWCPEGDRVRPYSFSVCSMCMGKDAIQIVQPKAPTVTDEQIHAALIESPRATLIRLTDAEAVPLVRAAMAKFGEVDSGGVAPAGEPSAEQNDATRPASSGNALFNDVVGGSSCSGEALPKP